VGAYRKFQHSWLLRALVHTASAAHAQLVGAVAQGIEPELAVQGQIFEGFGEGVQAQRPADGAVVVGALLGGQPREIAADQDLLQDLGRDLGRRAGGTTAGRSCGFVVSMA
jgi:hypothetical protein